MENTVDTIKLKDGSTLKIYQDLSPDNPRNWDNIADFICFHKRYILGDKHDIDHTDYTSFQDMADQNFSEDDIVMPLYMYDHSGITISTKPFSCPWDSGQIGWAVVPASRIKKEYGTYNARTKELALKCLLAEVETYDQYLRGETYGYVLEDFDGIEVESCWGFFGYDHKKSGLLEHAINLDEIA